MKKEELKKLNNQVIDYDIKNLDKPLYSKNNLIINNNVYNSEVVAEGNIICYADCENCVLESKNGTVFLLFGSLNSTNIKAKINIYIKHALKSTLTAGKDVIIEKSAYMSDIIAGDRVLSESKESKIIGGNIKAQNMIMSNEIGNEKSIKTKINIENRSGQVIFGKIHTGVIVNIFSNNYIVKNNITRGRIKIEGNNIICTAF